jgi:hypothetical protein
MNEPDIIRLKGVEYEYSRLGGSLLGPEKNIFGDLILVVRPKRAQTGWICRGCAYQCVVRSNLGSQPEDIMACGCCDAAWERFYGTVSE